MRGRPFEVGNQMGRGRPRGSRNKRAAFLELLEIYGPELIKQCQILALKGDPTALRLCIERLLPPCKAPNSRFRLPPVRTAEDLVKALPQLMQAVAGGRLSAQEGEAIARMIDGQWRAIEAEQFDARLRKLEEKSGEEPITNEKKKGF
jgi:hypothetical protein